MSGLESGNALAVDPSMLVVAVVDDALALNTRDRRDAGKRTAVHAVDVTGACATCLEVRGNVQAVVTLTVDVLALRCTSGALVESTATGFNVLRDRKVGHTALRAGVDTRRCGRARTTEDVACITLKRALAVEWQEVAGGVCAFCNVPG